MLGYSRSDFYDMSLKDIVELIRQHKRANEEQYKSANKQSKKDNAPKQIRGETFSYKRVED